MGDVLPIKPAELSVAIGFPCGPYVSYHTLMSLLGTVKHCEALGVPLSVLCVVNSSGPAVARSLVAQEFLDGAASRLFWIDSDMVWTPDDFMKLLGLSTKMGVVGATYSVKSETKPRFIVKHPDMTDFDMNEFGCLKVDGMGLGFTIVKREVIERLAAVKKPHIFREDFVDGQLRGEDIAFFADVAALGYDIWLDPTIELGHVGLKVYRGDPIKALRLEHIYRPAA